MAGKGYKRRITLEFDYASIQEGVPKTNKQMQTLNQTFKAAKAEADAYGTTAEKLAVKQDYLRQKMEILNKELAINKERLEQAKKSGNPEAVENYTIAVAKSEAALKSAAAEMVKTNDALKQQSEFLGLTKKEWEDQSQKLESLGQSMSKALTLPILAAGAGAVKVASDMEQTLGKVDVVFGQNSEAVKRWSQNSLRDFGLARSSALEAAADFGAMATNFGFASKDVATMSTELSARMMDFATFTNSSLDEVKDAFSGVFTGSAQSLKRFGIVMNQATLEQYAHSQGIRKSINDMTEAEKVQLRYNYVMEQTAMSVGNVHRESNTFSGQLALLKETVKSLGESFGQFILPVITPFLQLLNKLFEKVNSLDDGTKKFVMTCLTVVAAIGPMLILLSKMAKLGGGIASLLSATGGFGMLKWIATILGVVAAIAVLLAIIAVLTGKGKELNQTLGNVGQSARGISVGAMQSHAVGTNFIAEDHVALVHRGEAIIPAKSNPWNPDASTPYGGGGDTFNLTVSMDEVGEVAKLIDTVNGLKQYRRAYGN